MVWDTPGKARTQARLAPVAAIALLFAACGQPRPSVNAAASGPPSGPGGAAKAVSRDTPTVAGVWGGWHVSAGQLHLCADGSAAVYVGSIRLPRRLRWTLDTSHDPARFALVEEGAGGDTREDTFGARFSSPEELVLYDAIFEPEVIIDTREDRARRLTRLAKTTRCDPQPPPRTFEPFPFAGPEREELEYETPKPSAECEQRIEAFLAAKGRSEVRRVSSGSRHPLASAYLTLVVPKELPGIVAEQLAAHEMASFGLQVVAVTGDPDLGEELQREVKALTVSCDGKPGAYLLSDCARCGEECGTTGGICCAKLPLSCGPIDARTACDGWLRCEPSCCP